MSTIESYRQRSDYELPPMEVQSPMSPSFNEEIKGVTPELKEYLRSIEKDPIDFLISSTMEPIGNYFRFNRKNRRK